MALFDKNTWYILQHLHHTIAAQVASCIENGDRIQPQAYLISPAAAHDGYAGMHMAEIAPEFLEDMLSLPHGEQLLNQYLIDALQEGSVVQRQIDREHGIQARYTLCVQETVLPHADSQAQPRPALLVLMRGPHFALPIFHLIETTGTQQRRCHLRPFPDMQEIEAAQALLQVRPFCSSTLH